MAMTLRTDDELDAALTALAEASGMSRQEVIRRAVLTEYARSEHRAKVDRIAREVMVEYAETLDRLGTV
jgi:predicted transcriptional regulator